MEPAAVAPAKLAQRPKPAPVLTNLSVASHCGAANYIEDVELVIREEMAKLTPPNSPGRFPAERLGQMPPPLDLPVAPKGSRLGASCQQPSSSAPGFVPNPCKGSPVVRAAKVHWAPNTPSPPMSRDRLHKKARTKSMEEQGV